MWFVQWRMGKIAVLRGARGSICTFLWLLHDPMYLCVVNFFAILFQLAIASQVNDCFRLKVQWKRSDSIKLDRQ